MYSFGVLLALMHFPNAVDRIMPGQPILISDSAGSSSAGDADVIQLIHSLLAVEPKARPSAAQCVVHSYFRATFVDRLVTEGEVNSAFFNHTCRSFSISFIIILIEIN